MQPTCFFKVEESQCYLRWAHIAVTLRIRKHDIVNVYQSILWLSGDRYQATLDKVEVSDIKVFSDWATDNVRNETRPGKRQLCVIGVS